MRLCTFTRAGDAPGDERAGVVEGSRVFELATRSTVADLLRADNDKRHFVTKGGGHPLDEVSLHAPIPRPGKILATIVNTRGMLGGSDVTLDKPRLDMKAPSTVIGPGVEIRSPSQGIRPEVELAAIVGRRISRATTLQAESALFGYTILNDVTAPSDSRDDAYQAYRRDRATGTIRKTMLRGPLFRSKNHDTFCPMGPWISTPEEHSDWASLRMTTEFDGALVQDGSTSEYIFGPANIASYVSQFLTLETGDVVSCGSVGWTPAALGNLDPTEFVLPKKGGRLELEIEGIGRLANPVSFGP
jgi:2-keto-4-pentenoate hydratase/2-oxohepta-3-ene-1,7-dioic acid hydratase in catechol pathway